MDIISSTEGTVRSLLKMNPHQNLIVCNDGGQQCILQVGRDVIPYSYGVGDKK